MRFPPRRPTAAGAGALFAFASFALIAAAGAALVLKGDVDAAVGGWRAFATDVGDFSARRVLAAVLDHGDVAAAYRGDPLNTYPLPHELLLLPLALLHGYAARATATALAVLLCALGVLPFVERRRDLIPMLVSAPTVDLAVHAHVLAAMCLGGTGLAMAAIERRRWGLAGAALALALLRPPNALPVAALALVAMRGRPGPVLRAVAAGAAALLPLTVAAFLLDPGWSTDYVRDSSSMLAGLPLLADTMAGTPGVVTLAIAATALGAILGWPGPDALDRRRVALVTAVGALGSKVSGLYSGIFVLPAIAATAAEPSFRWAPWLASGLSWIAVLAAAPAVLAGSGLPAELAGVTYVLVVCAYPVAVSGLRGSGGARSQSSQE